MQLIFLFDVVLPLVLMTWGLVSIFVGLQKKKRNMWFGLGQTLRMNNDVLNIIIGAIFFITGLLLDILF